MSSEFTATRILLYREGILLHKPFVFDETYWANASLYVIMILHVSNWIAICCSISLVCAEIGWVNGDYYVWRCGDWVNFFLMLPSGYF